MRLLCKALKGYSQGGKGAGAKHVSPKDPLQSISGRDCKINAFPCRGRNAFISLGVFTLAAVARGWCWHCWRFCAPKVLALGVLQVQVQGFALLHWLKVLLPGLTYLSPCLCSEISFNPLVLFQCFASLTCTALLMTKCYYLYYFYSKSSSNKH